MIEIYERVFVGAEFDCRSGDEQWAIVHACKTPCHQREVGYRGSLPSTHPNYLVLERDNDLYLNIIDPPKPLFMPPTFTSFLEFAKSKWDEGKNVLIHCNQGESRAPSLAMMFLAKHLGKISDASFQSATEDFQQIYPNFQLGLGIQIYLNENWHSF
jgi:hypothetical protein